MSYMGLIVNCIGYQMSSADKLDDHAMLVFGFVY